MKATKEVNIYLTNKRNVVPVDVVQYDTGIQLVFTVKDFTIPNGSSATLYVQKPSGKFVYQEENITIADNAITVDLENQALTEHGRVPYQVTLTSGSDTVTSFAGLMLVERSLKDAGATESKTVIKAFDELTADKLAELQTNAKTVIDALISTIPEDYTAMTAKVNELANAIKGSLSGAVVRADDVSPVEHLPKVKIVCPENVDPSTVKVTRCGKNLLKPNSGSSSGKGLTFTNNGDGSFTVKGTATAAASFGLTRLTANPMYLHKDVTYTQSVIVLSGSMNGVAVVPSVEDSNGNVIWNYFSNNQTKTPEMYYRFRGYEVYVENGKTVDLKFKVQLEVGDTATDFEAYNGTEYTPNADGTVNGLTSLSPTMTLLTDTDGVIVECEYNKDTNKVIKKITDALGITI